MFDLQFFFFFSVITTYLNALLSLGTDKDIMI